MSCYQNPGLYINVHYIEEIILTERIHLELLIGISTFSFNVSISINSLSSISKNNLSLCRILSDKFQLLGRSLQTNFDYGLLHVAHQDIALTLDGIGQQGMITPPPHLITFLQ